MALTLCLRSTAAARAGLARGMCTSHLPVKLTADERKEMLPTVDGWKPVDGRDAIEKTFVFEDFTAAWDFMSKTARVADIVSGVRILSDADFVTHCTCRLQMNHHPEWFNVYNRVEVTLATHDCGGLSKFVSAPSARGSLAIDWVILNFLLLPHDTHAASTGHRIGPAHEPVRRRIQCRGTALGGLRLLLLGARLACLRSDLVRRLLQLLRGPATLPPLVRRHRD